MENEYSRKYPRVAKKKSKSVLLHRLATDGIPLILADLDARGWSRSCGVPPPYGSDPSTWSAVNVLWILHHLAQEKMTMSEFSRIKRHYLRKLSKVVHRHVSQMLVTVPDENVSGPIWYRHERQRDMLGVVSLSVLRAAMEDARVCGREYEERRQDPGALPCYQWYWYHVMWVIDHLVNTSQTVSEFAAERKLDVRAVSLQLRITIAALSVNRQFKEGTFP